MKLTRAAVDALTIPKGKSDAIVFDDTLPGFGVRLRSGGKRTWIAQYRTADGRQRRETIGRVDSLDIGKAREAARTIFAKVSLNRDPQAERIAAKAEAARSVGGVACIYLKDAERRLRSASVVEMRRYLNVHLSSLNKIGINNVARSDIAVALNAIRNSSGPVAADRARAALSGLYSWAMREGIATSNPVAFTNKPGTARQRERVLSRAELAAVWANCGDDDFGKIVRLLILTGQRRTEIGGMAWAELDLEAATWTIPGERSKNHKANVVPLSDPAIDILRSVRRVEGRPLLFGRDGTGFSGWSRAKARLASTLPASTAPWTLHDIRRSFGTHLNELGVAPHAVEALLNHTGPTKAGVAGTYNRALYMTEKRRAVVLWAEQVARPASTVAPVRGLA